MTKTTSETIRRWTTTNSRMVPIYLDDDQLPRIAHSYKEIPTRELWEEFRSRVDSFYDSYEDEAIVEYNEAAFRVFNMEMMGSKLKEKPTKRVRKHGFVYLVREVNGDHHKIGRAKDVAKRVDIFNVKLPFKVELSHVIESDDYIGCEEHLHRLYRKKRVDGEWFALDDGDVEFIRGIKAFNGGEWVR